MGVRGRRVVPAPRWRACPSSAIGRRVGSIHRLPRRPCPPTESAAGPPSSLPLIRPRRRVLPLAPPLPSPALRAAPSPPSRLAPPHPLPSSPTPHCPTPVTPAPPLHAVGAPEDAKSWAVHEPFLGRGGGEGEAKPCAAAAVQPSPPCSAEANPFRLPPPPPLLPWAQAQVRRAAAERQEGAAASVWGERGQEGCRVPLRRPSARPAGSPPPARGRHRRCEGRGGARTVRPRILQKGAAVLATACRTR